jgi:hypothetical protein
MSSERRTWTDTGRSPTAEQAERLIELFETLISVLEEIRDQHRPPSEPHPFRGHEGAPCLFATAASRSGYCDQPEGDPVHRPQASP